jgi:hypothetical protein
MIDRQAGPRVAPQGPGVIPKAVPRLPVLALLLLLPCATARAELKEWQLSIHPAYAVAYIDSRTAHGGGPALQLGFGVSDAVSIHVAGLVSFHAADKTDKLPAGSLTGYGAFVGITYTLDVIRLVPAFDLSFGAVGMRGDLSFGSDAAANAVLKPIDAFAISVGFSIEYLITRHVAVGAEVRYTAALTALDRLPMYLYCGPRVSFRFGG